MKILWVMKKYLDVAGDKAARIEMIKSLNKKEHRVVLLTGYRKEKNHYGLQGDLVYLPSVSIKYLNHLTFNSSLLFYLLHYIFRWKPEVVIMDYSTCFTAMPYTILRKIGLIRIKFVLDIRTLPVDSDGLIRRASELLFNLSIVYAKFLFDGITVISPYMKEYLAKKHRLKKSSIGIFSSGASIDHFNTEKIDLTKRLKFINKYSLQNKLVVMYHGHLIKNRGLSKAIEAMHIIKNRCGKIVLVIMGDGPAKESLKKLVLNKSLKDKVIIIDSVKYEYVPTYISIADIGIVPLPNRIGWRVSAPLKLMEYLAMGKPVIATDIEAHREILDSSMEELLTETNEPIQLATKILELSSQDRGSLDQLGLAGRKIIEDSYTWDAQASKLEQFLANIDK